MHISTRIQRCWSLLASAAAAEDDEFPTLLKPWISGDLARVSSRLDALVARSQVMQFILKTPAGEVPIDQAALARFRKAAASATTTADQERFFRSVVSMLHDVVCPEYDTCGICQSRRYLVLSNDSNTLCRQCECCGHVSSLDSEAYIELTSARIPTRSDLGKAC